MRIVFSVTLALIAATAATPACTSTQSCAPPNADRAIVMRSSAGAAWEVRDDGVVQGYVVRYDVPGSPERAYFSVRNRHRQEIGLVDGSGRAWRYRAHQREPDWLGTGTVVQGVQRVLGAGPTSALVDVPLARLLPPVDG